MSRQTDRVNVSKVACLEPSQLSGRRNVIEFLFSKAVTATGETHAFDVGKRLRVAVITSCMLADEPKAGRAI
jgi:hypothetical protein